jgi:hypothetical protein
MTFRKTFMAVINSVFATVHVNVQNHDDSEFLEIMLLLRFSTCVKYYSTEKYCPSRQYGPTALKSPLISCFANALYLNLASSFRFNEPAICHSLNFSVSTQ